LTVQQTRCLFSELLRDPPLAPSRIAARITAVLQRTEEARIYAWRRAVGRFPPPRGFPVEEKRLQ
jgi:hypothetical protein